MVPAPIPPSIFLAMPSLLRSGSKKDEKEDKGGKKSDKKSDDKKSDKKSEKSGEKPRTRIGAGWQGKNASQQSMWDEDDDDSVYPYGGYSDQYLGGE